jgi:hypothetical protein
MIDLSHLFEPQRPINVFEDLKAELNALSTGNKAMSVFTLAESDIGGQRYKEIVTPALDLGLSVSHYIETFGSSDRAIKELRIFIFSPEQSWKIPAYLATRKIMSNGYAWSDGAEYLESYLLGYSEGQISEWMERFKNRRASWKGTLSIYSDQDCQEGLRSSWYEMS